MILCVIITAVDKGDQGHTPRQQNLHFGDVATFADDVVLTDAGIIAVVCGRCGAVFDDLPC